MILKAVLYCLISYFISRKLIDSMMCQTHCRRFFAYMVLYLNIFTFCLEVSVSCFEIPDIPSRPLTYKQRPAILLGFGKTLHHIAALLKYCFGYFRQVTIGF